jgi:hypothetical protein
MIKPGSIPGNTVIHNKPVLGFVAETGFPPLADSGNWHNTTNFSDLQRETYSRKRFNSGKPISAIS